MGNRNFHPALVPAESKLKLGRCSAAPNLLSLAQMAYSAMEISVRASSSGTSSGFEEGPGDGDAPGVTVQPQPWYKLSGEVSASFSDRPKKTGITSGVAWSPILSRGVEGVDMLRVSFQ